MKTKFFKKLSFVLVVAMVLSVFAPAAGVFAAKAPKLNSTKKYLHLDVDKLNEFNFNISNKGKGWKYYWETADEEVAVVNEKNGVVTATGVGTTKVTCYITDKDGEEITDLTATVVVRDNIKTVKITNVPEDNKLAVDEANDFNRSFETVSGSKKKTSAITRWTVEPAEGATIDEKGVFVATEAGKYTVTALSFQSKARYEAWLDDAETYKDYVLATDSIEITVAASMLEAKQVDTDTVKVIFDSEMTDVDKDLNLYQLVGTTKVKQLIKEVKMSDDKKSADVTLYVPFTQEATYVVEYPEMEDVSFVAARKKAEDVSHITIDTTKAIIGEDTEIVVKLFNADNVDISDGEGLASRVTLEAEEVAGTYFDGHKSLIIFEKDKAVKVTATYHTYDWDTTTGEEKGNLQAVGMIVGVDADQTNITGLNAWTIVKEKEDGTFAPDFDNVKHVIAAEDEYYRLFVKFNTKTGNSTDTVNSNDDWEDFTFESSNDEVMIVGSDGSLYPNKQGVVNVVVKYGKDGATKNPVGVITITVNPKAKASNLVLGTYELRLSNIISDSKEVSLKLTDQTGREVPFTTGDIEVKKVSGPEIVDEDDFIVKGDKKVTFNGLGQEKGRYSFKITVKEVTRYITVNIVSADADADVAKYVLELGNSKVDLKAEDKKVNKSISIELFGLASNGTKIDKAVIDGENFKIVVDAPYSSTANWDYIQDDHNPAKDNTSVEIDGHTVSLFDGTNYTLAQAASGGSIKKAPVGTYKVTAYHYKEVNETMKWVPVSNMSFVVEDTQAQPAVSKVKTLVYDSVDSSDPDSVKAVVADCFEIKLNGVEMTDIQGVDYSGTDESLYIRSITVRKHFDINEDGDQTWIDFKVNVGRTIRKK